MTRLVERISDRVLSFVAPEAAADAGCTYIQNCENRCAGARAYAICHYEYCSGGIWKFLYREACDSC